MNLKLLIVDDNNISRFKGKLPFDLKDIVKENPEREIIGAIDRQEKGSVPVGVCWGYYVKDSFVLEYIYVVEEERNKGIAKQMFSDIITGLYNSDIKAVCCGVERGDSNSEVILRLLAGYGFKLKERSTLKVSVKAADVLSKHDEYEYTVPRQNMIAIKEASKAKMSDADAKALQKIVSKGGIDKDISYLCISEKNDLLAGMFVSRKTGEECFFEGTYISAKVKGESSAAALSAMLAEEICKKIIEIDGPEARITVSSDRDRFGGFTIDLLDFEQLELLELEFELKL